MRSHNVHLTSFPLNVPKLRLSNIQCALNPAGYKQTAGRHACNITERPMLQLQSDVLRRADKQLTARAKQRQKYGGELPNE